MCRLLILTGASCRLNPFEDLSLNCTPVVCVERYFWAVCEFNLQKNGYNLY